VLTAAAGEGLPVAAGEGLPVAESAGLLIGAEGLEVEFDPVAHEVTPGDVSSGAFEGDAPTPAAQAAATSAVQAAVASVRAITV
jgi:hypothetical protein